MNFVNNFISILLQNDLPVMEFHYGLMTSPLQNATITIGPLECKTEEQESRPTAIIIVDPNNPFDPDLFS